MLAKLKTALVLFIISVSVQAVIVPAFDAESGTVNSVRTNITFERVFHDGYWWIIVYENDLKISEYIDPNQD